MPSVENGAWAVAGFMIALPVSRIHVGLPFGADAWGALALWALALVAAMTVRGWLKRR